MFVFLILFGLAAIVLILVVATIRGRRAGLPPGSGYSGDTGGTGVAGWTADWDRRSTDPTNDSDPGDWGGGSSDGGGGATPAGEALTAGAAATPAGAAVVGAVTAEAEPTENRTTAAHVRSFMRLRLPALLVSSVLALL